MYNSLFGLARHVSIVLSIEYGICASRDKPRNLLQVTGYANSPPHPTQKLSHDS